MFHFNFAGKTVYSIEKRITFGNLTASGDDEPYEKRYIYNANNDLLRQESTFDNEDRISLQSYYGEDGLLTKVDYFYDESDGETPDYVEEFKYNDEGLVTHTGEAISDPSFTTDITYQDLGDIDWVPSEKIKGITIGEYSYCFHIESSINF